jgi:hypothetical protein
MSKYTIGWALDNMLTGSRMRRAAWPDGVYVEAVIDEKTHKPIFAMCGMEVDLDGTQNEYIPWQPTTDDLLAIDFEEVPWESKRDQTHV